MWNGLHTSQYASRVGFLFRLLISPGKTDRFHFVLELLKQNVSSKRGGGSF